MSEQTSGTTSTGHPGSARQQWQAVPHRRRRRAASLVAAAVSAVLLAIAPAASAAPATHLRFLTINVPGATSTNVVSINNQGVIAGSYTNSTGQHGFIMAGSQFTRFSYPGSSSTTAESINDHGAVVGVYIHNGTPAGYLRAPGGQFTSLTDPLAGTGPDQGTYANSINDHGVIAGDYITSANIEHGFLYRSRRFTTVDVPHGFYGTPGSGNGIFSLNGAGIMVGPYTPNRTGVLDGYVNSAGHFYTITGPGAGPSTDTFPGGISDSGAIVGRTLGPSLIYHGWLLSGWRYTRLNDPQATTTPVKDEVGGTAPTDINQFGVVVGRYWDTHHTEHGFVVYTGATHGATLLLHKPQAASSHWAGTRTARRLPASMRPVFARLTN
jgi:hypothetical protein